jgi:ribose transport system substrate-binding protein
MTSNTGHRKKPARVAALLALLAIAALALSACGGGSSSSSSSAGGSAGANGGAGNAAADKVAAVFTQRPTRIPVTQPIGRPIPSGKRIDFINCGVTSCTILYNNLVQAAKTVGWTVKQINTQGTPETVQAAWKQAVNDRPDAVIASGFPRAVFAKQLKQLQALNIPVLEASTDDTVGGGIDLMLNGPDAMPPIGRILAAWVAKDSGGKANTLYVDLPNFGILKPVHDSFVRYNGQFCASCKVDTLDVPVTAIGKDVPDRVVSYLRAHPDINYVAYSLGALNVGVPAALRQAGLADKVKTIVDVGDAENYQYIASGQTQAATSFSNVEEPWVWVDALARKFTGQSIAVDRQAKMPLMLITKSNLISTSAEFPMVADYRQQWKKLWGKG